MVIARLDKVFISSCLNRIDPSASSIGSEFSPTDMAASVMRSAVGYCPMRMVAASSEKVGPGSIAPVTIFAWEMRSPSKVISAPTVATG